MLLRRLFMRSIWLALVVALFALITGCDVGAPPVPPTATPTEAPPPTNTPIPLPTDTPRPPETPTPVPIPVSERKYVPILCYHHIREWRKSDVGDDRAYIVPPDIFEEQLQYLKKEGYQSVTSEQVYQYYANGRPLPDKPIMLSFDDNDDNQYTTAVPLLKKYGFNATFFIMTVTIDKENYMTSEQLKDLAKQGYDIQAHTWDHHMVTKYETEEDWQLQIVQPKKELEELLGQPVDFFAYPFGIYNAEAAEKVKSYGYKAAFRLSEVMDEDADPVFAIKRYIANPYFTQAQFEAVLAGDW